MTHQMEHFKEIHTQFSWLSYSSSLSSASLSLNFPVTLSFPSSMRTIKHSSQKAKKKNNYCFCKISTRAPLHTDTQMDAAQVGGIHLWFPDVNLDLFTWAVFLINIFFLCACFSVCLSVCLYHICTSCACVSLSLSLTAELTFPSQVCPRLELTQPSAMDQADTHTDNNTSIPTLLHTCTRPHTHRKKNHIYAKRYRCVLLTGETIASLKCHLLRGTFTAWLKILLTFFNTFSEKCVIGNVSYDDFLISWLLHFKPVVYIHCIKATKTFLAYLYTFLAYINELIC